MRGRVASAEEPEAWARAGGRACELMFARASARARVRVCTRVPTNASDDVKRANGGGEAYVAGGQKGTLRSDDNPYTPPGCRIGPLDLSACFRVIQTQAWRTALILASITPATLALALARIQRWTSDSNDRHLEPLSWLLDPRQ